MCYPMVPLNLNLNISREAQWHLNSSRANAVIAWLNRKVGFFHVFFARNSLSTTTKMLFLGFLFFSWSSFLSVSHVSSEMFILERTNTHETRFLSWHWGEFSWLCLWSIFVSLAAINRQSLEAFTSISLFQLYCEDEVESFSCFLCVCCDVAWQVSRINYLALKKLRYFIKNLVNLKKWKNSVNFY